MAITAGARNVFDRDPPLGNYGVVYEQGEEVPLRHDGGEHENGTEQQDDDEREGGDPQRRQDDPIRGRGASAGSRIGDHGQSRDDQPRAHEEHDGPRCGEAERPRRTGRAGT